MNPLLAKIRAEKAAREAAAAPAPAPTPAQPTTTQAAGGLMAKLAAQRAAMQKSVHLIGQADQTGASVPDQKLAVNTLQKPVAPILAKQESVTEQAKSLVQRRAEEGFYQIDKPELLPTELPALIVEQRLLDLDSALQARTPELTSLCVLINQNLRQYEELAYLLNDDQLHLVVESNLAAANVMISSGKATDKSKATQLKAKYEAMSDDDFT